jgi:hypothetical protein
MQVGRSSVPFEALERRRGVPARERRNAIGALERGNQRLER